MPILQHPRNQVVPVGEQIDGDRDGLSDGAFDRKPPTIDLGLQPLDNQASSIGSIGTIANIAGLALQPGRGSGFVRLTRHTHDRSMSFKISAVTNYGRGPAKARHYEASPKARHYEVLKR
jgi:hypothetical protein